MHNRAFSIAGTLSGISAHWYISPLAYYWCVFSGIVHARFSSFGVQSGFIERVSETPVVWREPGQFLSSYDDTHAWRLVQWRLGIAPWSCRWAPGMGYTVIANYLMLCLSNSRVPLGFALGYHVRWKPAIGSGSLWSLLVNSWQRILGGTFRKLSASCDLRVTCHRRS